MYYRKGGDDTVRVKRVPCQARGCGWSERGGGGGSWGVTVIRKETYVEPDLKYTGPCDPCRDTLSEAVPPTASPENRLAIQRAPSL